MKGAKLFDALGNIDEALLERSEKKANKTFWPKWVAIASCVALIVCVTVIMMNMNQNQSMPNTENGVPGISIKDIEYYRSGWDTAVEECPDGFEYGGTVDTTNDDGAYLMGCKYYINNDIPEWAYVYCKIWDEYNNTSMAYVRFVTADIRWNVCINYNGQIYTNLLDYTGDNKLELEDRYGLQIEAEVPEGCILIGSACLEALDRIPQIDLGVNSPNYNGAEVYADPDDSEVLYIGASWYTSMENEETLHSGYDVFVLYNANDVH